MLESCRERSLPSLRGPPARYTCHWRSKLPSNASFWLSSWPWLQLRKLDRNREPPEDGPMCEMLWNDPMEGRGMIPNKASLGGLFVCGKVNPLG